MHKAPGTALASTHLEKRKVASYLKLIIEILGGKTVGPIDFVLLQNEARPVYKCRVEGKKEGPHASPRANNYRREACGLVYIAL